MQFKKGDRVRIDTWKDQGTVVEDCLDGKLFAFVRTDLKAPRCSMIEGRYLELVPSAETATRYVWRNDTFEGHYPVGTAALVIAKTQGRAAYLLNAELRRKGLPGDVKPEEMVLTLPDEEQVIILHDGDY